MLENDALCCRLPILLAQIFREIPFARTICALAVRRYSGHQSKSTKGIGKESQDANKKAHFDSVM